MAAKRQKTSKEPTLIRYLLARLHAVGVMAWRARNSAVYDSRRGTYRRFAGLRGIPDVIGIMPGGRMIAVEVKATGALSPEQRAVMSKIDALGGLAVIVRSTAEADAVCDWIESSTDEECR